MGTRYGNGGTRGRRQVDDTPLSDSKVEIGKLSMGGVKAAGRTLGFNTKVAAAIAKPKVSQGIKLATATPARTAVTAGATGGLLATGATQFGKAASGFERTWRQLPAAAHHKMAPMHLEGVDYDELKPRRAVPVPKHVPSARPKYSIRNPQPKYGDFKKRDYNPEHRRQRRLGMAEAALVGGGLFSAVRGGRGIVRTSQLGRKIGGVTAKDKDSVRELHSALKHGITARRRDLAYAGGGATAIGAAGGLHAWGEGHRGRAWN
jgi:hypothetical protein